MLGITKGEFEVKEREKIVERGAQERQIRDKREQKYWIKYYYLCITQENSQ